MASRKNSVNETIETEIVVVGGGGSGLAAAVAAAEMGLKVVVLEKRGTLGGNTKMAEGLFAAESPPQKRMMIDARRDHLFRIAMKYSHWTLDPKIIRAFIDKSGDTVEWLERKGVKFTWIPHLYPNQIPRTWHCLKKGGAVIIKALLKDCEELGVTIMKQCAVKKILMNDGGKLTGVLASAKKIDFQIGAKAIIIASGGYGGNKALLKKHYPTYSEEMVLHGMPHMGDGLIMATEIGAATEGLGVLQLCGPRLPGSYRLSAVAQEPTTIWVNKRGERFTDETVAFNFPEAANAIERQPGRASFSLFDATTKQNVMEKGLIKGAGVNFVAPGTKLTDLETDLRIEEEKGRIKSSNSWNNIAKWMELTTESLTQVIDEYNTFCDQRYDKIFNKDQRYLWPLRRPPFYAIRMYQVFHGTIGGIKINHHMEILNHQDNPLLGLYAVGTDAGGWESHTYNAELSGSSFGFALNSGRIAGENAAKYVRI